MVCDALSQEPYENVIERSRIINSGKLFRKGVVISSLSEGSFPRSIASQACDMMVKAKDIEAAFVICSSDKGETIVTARSRGSINVQVIMEKMGGGGHQTMAATQLYNISLDEARRQLIEAIDAALSEAEAE